MAKRTSLAYGYEVVLKERKHMADDTSIRSQGDRTRINTSQDHEVRYWAKELGCTPEELKAAVQAAGNQVDRVRDYVKQRGR
jgi:hypothetical protein